MRTARPSSSFHATGRCVEGVEPGLYRWPDLQSPLGRGNLGHELLRACWDQDLGRDAAHVVMSAIDSFALDDRGYRAAPLAALLFTCVGVPTYRNTAGGQPGNPVSVLTPTAGETPTS
jgi:hypothetical protein